MNNDQNVGCGGSYAIDEVSGERKLIARTLERAPAPPPEPVPAPDPAPVEQPAEAGFFTPTPARKREAKPESPPV